MLIFGLMVVIVNAGVIPLVRTPHGSYEVLVTFSDGSREYFMLDTGATITAMSPETFVRLTKSRRVLPTYLGEGHATLADNSRVTIDLWEFEQISLSPTVVVHNLEVMVAPSGGSNLLGMNFLSQMGTWSINSSNSTLITGQQTTPSPSQNQLPPHVEVVDNEGHTRPAKGYMWVDPTHPGNAVIPVPTHVVTNSLTQPYQYHPEPGYRWANPNDVLGSRFAVVAIPSNGVYAAPKVGVGTMADYNTTPIPGEEAGVIPHQRVYNFALGMTKKEVMKLGKPQDQITTGLSAGVQLWKYTNKNTGNTLQVYFDHEQVSLICFTNQKFSTVEGITTANFDTPNAMLTYTPATPGLSARFDYAGRGLFYLVSTREGCVVK